MSLQLLALRGDGESLFVVSVSSASQQWLSWAVLQRSCTLVTGSEENQRLLEDYLSTVNSEVDPPKIWYIIYMYVHLTIISLLS